MKELLHCSLDFADKILHQRSLASFWPGRISASARTLSRTPLCIPSCIPSCILACISIFISAFASRLGMAPVGRRDDYRRRDEWGNPTTPANSWRNKIPSGLPVSLTGIILAICIIIFFLRLVAPYFVVEYLSLIPAILFDRPWTIVTYMFVHLTFDHLFWNMLFLFFFGMALEQRVGERMFLVIFLLSGVVAAVGQILALSGMDSFVPMVGASGALFGVLGCLAIIAPEIRVLLFFVIPLSIKWAVVLYALVDFLSLGAADNIAHMAHITGLFVGLAFGYALRKKPRYYNI